MPQLKEYIVTAKTMADATSLVEDMESPGGNLYIPNRRVEITQLREISRNTHFMITKEEAAELRNDPRVIAVEELPSAIGIEPTPHWAQLGNFEKSATIDTNDKNWGLYRVIAGQSVSGWGTNGSFTQTTQSISTTSSGKHVDVVVVDSHINFDHPEFAVNSSGQGGSRAVQYDWFQHSSYLGYATTGSYSYTTISSNHGTHTAGTCAGNTQGWARDANIYNIEFDYTDVNAPAGDWALYIFDYIRAFHKNKPINPATGRRNPTITNNSWGYSYNNISTSSVTAVTYQGITTPVNGTWSEKKVTLENNGVPVPAGTYLYRMPARYAALDADVEDAIADGIIVVVSAGNSYWATEDPQSLDYNNNMLISGSTYYHSQGSSPNSDSTISVGAISTNIQEYKSTFSNYGSRVDIYAPGQNIVSAVYDTTASSEFGVTIVNDPRDSNFKLASISGTSMAGPQVTGCLACLLEQQQSLTQSEALEYLIQTSKKSQITSTGGNAGDYTSLGDRSNNRYLFYKLERPLSGNVSANNRYKSRAASGAVYPRSKLRVKG